MLLVFIVYKIPHLSLPLFWDEMGVYGKSVFYLLDNGIGFQPKYLDPELSRGHPMLFVFIASIFTKIFGGTSTAMHWFALLISISTLVSVFYIGKQLYTSKVGLFATVLLVAQPMFIAQSVMILPEIMLALLFLWTVYFFLKEKWIYYFIACSLALLTKETTLYLPLVLAFVLGAFHLILNRKRKILLKEILIILSPFLVFFIFLLVQKQQNGWYFFPYHNPFEGDKGFFDLDTIIQKFKGFYLVLFSEQGRKYVSIIASILFLPLFFTWNRKKQYQVLVFVGVIVGLLLFSATNHFVKRYMLAGMVFYVFIVALIFNSLLKSKPIIQYFIIFALMFCSLLQLKTPYFDYGNNMSYISFLDFQKDLTHMIENQEKWQDSVVVKSNFPMNLSFEDNRYGFSNRNIYVNMTKNDVLPQYYIVTNLGSSAGNIPVENYKEIFFKPQGFCSVKIYEKVN